MKKFLGVTALLVLIVPAALLAPDLGRMRVTASSDALLLESDPALKLYNETRLAFGTDEYVILAAEVDDPLSDASLALLADLEEGVLGSEDDAAAVDQVESALSILTVPLLRSRPGASFGIMPTYIDNPAAPPTDEADLELARQELHGHEFFEKLLVSEDWKIVAVFAYVRVPARQDELYGLRWVKRREIEASTDPGERVTLTAELAALEAEDDPLRDALEVRRRALVERLRVVTADVSARHGTKVFMVGVPVINVNMADYVRHDLRVFGVVSLVLAFLALVVLLSAGSLWRGLLRAFLVILSAVLPVLVTLLCMVWLQVPMSVVTCNLPSLLFVLSLAHGIHLVERWRRLGSSEGLAGVTKNLVVPCALTATTTVAGFLSLIVTDLRPVIDFGTFMSIGVGLAVVSAFWIVPAGLSLVSPAQRNEPPSPGEGDDPDAGSRGSVDRVLALAARVSIGAGRVVIATALIVLVLALVGASRLTAETRFSDYFKDDSEIVVGLEMIDQRLVGVTTLEVVCTAPEGKSFLSSWGVDRLERVEALARELPSLSRVESIAGLYREFKKSMPLSADDALPMAMNFDAARDVGLGYVTADGGTAMVKIRLHETDRSLDRTAVMRQLRDGLASVPELAEINPQLTGVFVLHGNLLNSLISSQLKSLVYVSVAILVMFLAIFRSLGAALIGLVPNVLPVVLVLGIMGFAGIALDLVTVMIASVAMGIGVDAAIHYLYAYRAAIREGAEPAAAVRRAHGTVGRPILFAAVTVVAAFGVLVTSEFIPSIYFGLFTALTMAAALTGTLTLIPALLLRLRPFRPRRA